MQSWWCSCKMVLLQPPSCRQHSACRKPAVLYTERQHMRLLPSTVHVLAGSLQQEGRGGGKQQQEVPEEGKLKILPYCIRCNVWSRPLLTAVTAVFPPLHLFSLSGPCCSQHKERCWHSSSCLVAPSGCLWVRGCMMLVLFNSPLDTFMPSLKDVCSPC